MLTKETFRNSDGGFIKIYVVFPQSAPIIINITTITIFITIISVIIVIIVIMVIINIMVIIVIIVITVCIVNMVIILIMIIIVIMVMMVRTLNMFCRKTSSSSARIRSWTALWYRNSYIHHFGIIIIHLQNSGK